MRQRSRRIAKRLAVWMAVGTMSASLIVNFQTPAHADSLVHERQVMQQLQQEAAQTNQQISSERAQASTLQSRVDRYQSSLQNIQSAIHSNQHQMNAVRMKIHTLQNQMQENQSKLTADKAALVGQVRAMYEDGRTDYLGVLLGANSLHDLLSRIYLLATVAQKQKELADRVTHLQHELALDKSAQQGAYRDLAAKSAQMHTYEQAEFILEERNKHALADVKQTILSESRRTTVLESQIQLTQQQIQQIQSETQQAQQLMQSPSYVQQQKNALVNADASSLLRYAENFMGVPYVWGGTSPSGFDCSGFVQYVFEHFGVNLNRTSEDQFAEGVPVSTSHLQPGDLVFFSTYAPGATHVGIYMGNGMMIDAEDRGVVVDNMFNSYWGPKFIGARQVLQNG